MSKFVKISDHIKHQRKDEGLSLRAFAKKYGVSYMQVKRLEDGELDSPSILQASRICFDFNITPDFMAYLVSVDEEFDNIEKRKDYIKKIEASLDGNSFIENGEKVFSRFCEDNSNITGYECPVDWCEDVYPEGTFQDLPILFDNLKMSDGSTLYDATCNLTIYDIGEDWDGDNDGMVELLGQTIEGVGVDSVALYYLPLSSSTSPQNLSRAFNEFTSRYVSVLHSEDSFDCHLFMTTSPIFYDYICQKMDKSISIDKRSIAVVLSKYNTDIKYFPLVEPAIHCYTFDALDEC